MNEYAKKLLKLFLLATILISSLGIYHQLVFHYSLKDTVVRTLFFPFFDTSWAPEFNESNFLKVKIGMSKEQVINLLGKPLRETCLDACECVYSWQKTPTASFDRRAVYFNRIGQVTETVKDVFLD